MSLPDAPPLPDPAHTTAVRKSWQAEFAEAQSTRRVNVVCMKWGDRYPAVFVNRLYAMVLRHTSWDINFVCFTDDATGIRPEVAGWAIGGVALLSLITLAIGRFM
ncbi:MAG: hypothetical protein SH859_10080 [Hyphomicrobium aestuarii]|nr:hypothetical protein [Hyphomicrobium aestuarii]